MQIVYDYRRENPPEYLYDSQDIDEAQERLQNVREEYNEIKEDVAYELEKYRKELKDEYGMLVFPEAYACLMPLVKSAKIASGMSLMVDIGGGTTDISFFTIENRSPQVYAFYSINKGLNFLTAAEIQISKRADSNVKNENEIINKTKEIIKPLDEKRIAKGLKKRSHRALIVGIPNVGKSTLINRLVGKKVTQVGNKPGVTKNLNFLPTKYGITLLDSPGILWPKLDNIVHAYNMATIGSIKKEVLNISDIGMYIINFYLKSYPNILKDIYKTSETDAIEVFDNLSLKWGFTKNGETDFTKVSERLYNDIIGGKIKGITLDEEKTDN